MAESEDTTVGVLIVDDHRMFAESLARLLADEEGIDGARAWLLPAPTPSRW